MNSFLDNQIYQLEQKKKYIEHLKVAVNKENNINTALLFDRLRDIVRLSYDDSCEHERMTAFLLADALNANPNPDRFRGRLNSILRHRRMLRKHNMYTGMWVQYSYVTQEEPIDAPNVMYSRYGASFWRVKVVAVITEFFDDGSNIMANIIWPEHDIICSASVEIRNRNFSDGDSFIGSITEQQLIDWKMRHTVSKIRGHIRRWRQHVNYKPGSKGYIDSESNFKHTITNLK